MQNLLQYILPFESPHSFPDNTFVERYNEWDKPSRQIQVCAITSLTAILYVIFTLINKPWASEPVQTLMLKAHLLIIVPILLTISFLAYKKRFYNIVMPALAAHSIIAMSCHVYIASKLSNNQPYLAEGYLAVFWIFIASGMTFRYALFSAVFSSIILLVSAFSFIKQTDIYIMYVFWIVCSFSFGFLGALIFDRSRKAIFISQQKLLRMAVTDPLTGVFNRNQLNKILPEEIARGLRYDTSFGLLIIDIDLFKEVNDTFGHDAGDKVLRKTAQLLGKSIRENDTLVRWGGEEFVVIAMEVDEPELIQLSEKLRKIVETEDHGTAGSITVSIGATLHKKNDSQHELLSRADKALYKAKENGRNTTVCI